MKKIIITVTLLISLLLIIGCVNYKSYQPTNNENNLENSEETDLLKEIEAIEQELELEAQQPETEEPTEEIVVEEVVIPELEEETGEKPTKSSDEQVVTVKENEKISLKPKLNDPDNDPITITYSKPLDDNGEWKTNYGDAGEYVVTISATDGKVTTERKIKIVVERVNIAPTITALEDITVNEGETVTFSPEATDPNGDKVTLTVSKPLNEESFTTDYTTAGEYKITVTASDGELETQESFKLTINDVNQKPEITNLQDFTIKEGETLTIDPEVTDLDGDDVKVTISEPVGEDGTWELGYTDNGEYMVTVTADDGKDTVTKKVKVTVEDVNAPVEFLDIAVEVN